MAYMIFKFVAGIMERIVEQNLYMILWRVT